MKLSAGQWRLFLLSSCVHSYHEVVEYAKDHLSTKSQIISITPKDVTNLNKLITKEQAEEVKARMMKEWKFTGKVIDLGAKNYSTCEYCQKQEIRYEYICQNQYNRTNLFLGSVCVGRIIFGEEAMKDQVFSDKFVKDMESKKKSAKPSLEQDKKDGAPVSPVLSKINYIKSHGNENNDFIKSLEQRYNRGLALTDKQTSALDKFYNAVQRKVDTPSVSSGGVNFSNSEAEEHYNKVLEKLKSKPDNEFYKSCKLRIERFGCLTPNMIHALMRGSKQEASEQPTS